jgi:hypothetical protein
MSRTAALNYNSNLSFCHSGLMNVISHNLSFFLSDDPVVRPKTVGKGALVLAPNSLEGALSCWILHNGHPSLLVDCVVGVDRSCFLQICPLPGLFVSSIKDSQRSSHSSILGSMDPLDSIQYEE